MSRSLALQRRSSMLFRPSSNITRYGGPNRPLLLPHVNRTVLCIIGTRPEVIKMAPVIRALNAVPGLAVRVLNSGQHRDLLARLIDWFEFRVDADLRAMTEDQSLSELTARLMRGFEQSFAASRPDLVLAQGDTTTVMCSALSCFYLGIPF